KYAASGASAGNGLTRSGSRRRCFSSRALNERPGQVCCSSAPEMSCSPISFVVQRVRPSASRDQSHIPYTAMRSTVPLPTTVRAPGPAHGTGYASSRSGAHRVIPPLLQPPLAVVPRPAVPVVEILGGAVRPLGLGRRVVLLAVGRDVVRLDRPPLPQAGRDDD